LRDVVIGMDDGLTVSFALAAGLAAAVSSKSSRDRSRPTMSKTG